MVAPTEYEIGFSMLKGIHPDVATAILDVVGSEEEFFLRLERELSERVGMASRLFDEGYRRQVLERARLELDYLERKAIGTCYFRNSDYPVRFQTVPDAPLMLYTVGPLDLNAKRLVSIVGTRNATRYGVECCRNLVLGLKEQVGDDVVIVSGLAYGIDVAAHQAALEAGLPTVAVVAHGLDTIYPAVHRAVAIEIINQGGAVVTEYPHGVRAHRSNFLARNRIIAALSDCTVVVESAFKGGSLVTANIAQGYGRDVFAFPGRVGDEHSEGCNALIRKNVAALITGVADLSSQLGWECRKLPEEEPTLFVVLSPEEQVVADAMEGREVVGLNELCTLTDYPVHKLMDLLFSMEMQDVVAVFPGNRYALRKK